MSRRVFYFLVMPTLLLAWFFVLGQTARAVEQPDHLWHFDECEGQFLKDSGGAENLPQNAVWVLGKWDCAINQSWQAQYYIEKTFSTALPAGELTLSLYWRNSSFPNEGRNHVYLKKADGNIAAGVRPSIYSKTLYYDGGATTAIPDMPSDNNWHLITITYGSSNLVYYVDGTQKAIFNGNYAISSLITGLEMKGENWPVEMDEMAIWSRVLSAGEVADIYNSHAPLAPYSAPVQPEKTRMIHLWHFDEGAGSLINDAVGQTNLPQNAGWAIGKWGSSLYQSWPTAQRINANFDQPINSRDLTMEFWWKNSSSPNEGRGDFFLTGPKGKLSVRPSIHTSSLNIPDYIFFYHLSIYPYDGEWHHLALVIDSSNYLVNFYIDGQLKYTTPHIPLINFPLTSISFFGENFPYQVDEFAVWQGALTQAEIKDYYDSGQPHSADAELEPVILVPGIMGSYLYSHTDPGVEVWPAVLKTVADPWDLHLNQLIMDEQGKPLPNTMIVPPQDIIRSVLNKDFFQGLINELKQNGYEENKNLFVFPYDWRLDLNWTANGIPYSGFDSLKDKIEKIKSQTGAQKVSIIAHSLGGLAAKNYIKHYGSGSVDKFIDIGTPHLGAPEALKILMYGDDLDFNYLGIGLNSERIKTISQNFPSVYQLLPSQNYFDSANPDYAYYLYDMHDLDNNGIKNKLDYVQSIDFMKNTGRNNYLLGYNNALHSDLDNYSPKSDGIKTYNLVGCGQPTIGQIFILNKEKSGGYEYGLKYISGDGTVPLRSAQALTADDSYYVRGVEHSALPSANGIKQMAAAILKGAIGSFPWQDYPAMASTSAGCSLTGTQISFHSPIELNVYDENNNHVGPNENGDIEIGIEGAQYDDLDGNKFVFLPEGHNYRVEGQATASGSFNARAQTIINGQYTQTAYYNEVPLDSAGTVAKLQVNSGQPAGAMELDQDGDQIFETIIEPSAVLNQGETGDLIKPETQIEISGTVGNDNYYISTTTVILTATDNQGGSGILKVEYSLNNGLTWQNYENPIIFYSDGEHNIIYKSTDRAGNVEEEKAQKLKIDIIAPVINILLPLEGQEFFRDEFFTPEYEITDSYSGAATSSLAVFIDDQPIGQSEQDLFYYDLGEHVLKITVLDLAGNQAEASVKFTVSADLDSTISDVNRSYSLGWMENEKTKSWLNKELNEIKKYEEKFGQRQKKQEQNREKIMDRCPKKKSQAWCEKRLKNYDKVVYKLNQIHKKIITKRYQGILKKLDDYYKKQWLSKSAYDIIKADINYLINNL